MSDRDDLARIIANNNRLSEGRLRKCPAHPGHAPFFAVHACPWCEVSKLQAARSTVTPEQVEAAAKAGHALDAGDALPYWSWDSSVPSRQKLYRDIARAAAHAFGLSVAEDGEQ